jgi:hypothetical protein
MFFLVVLGGKARGPLRNRLVPASAMLQWPQAQQLALA